MSEKHRAIAGSSAGRPSTLARGNVSRGIGRRSWWGFALITVITAVAVLPIAVIVLLALRPGVSSTSTATFTLSNFSNVLTKTLAWRWLVNSVLVALATVVVSVVIAAPAGYVLSRGRGRLISGYALLLFVIQSLPAITAVIPLFFIFSKLRLVDTLAGIVIIYISASLAVAIWIIATYMDSIPISLEEAAWIDGASMFGSFLKIVLRNSGPAIISAAIFAFLVAWNDYLVAIVFLRTDTNFTLQVGVQSFFQQVQVDWGSVMATAVIMMLPPVVVFALLNRFFNIGGIGGALAGS
jgi:multiple sugar transport system permease protein